MSFPELLRQCRKQKHMSQAELASLLGVTQQAVGKWESGKSSPDPTTVAKLAEILDTTADYLLGLFDPTAEGQTEERFFGSYVYSLIPVIGTVKAGYGALAYEEDYGKEYARVKDPSSYFYLVVRGVADIDTKHFVALFQKAQTEVCADKSHSAQYDNSLLHLLLLFAGVQSKIYSTKSARGS